MESQTPSKYFLVSHLPLGTSGPSKFANALLLVLPTSKSPRISLTHCSLVAAFILRES